MEVRQMNILLHVACRERKPFLKYITSVIRLTFKVCRSSGDIIEFSDH